MPVNIRGTTVEYDSRDEFKEVWQAIGDLRQEHLELQNLVEQMIDVFQSLIGGRGELNAKMGPEERD